MSTMLIKPSHLSGIVTIPPSKSLSHRAIICASLANGVSKISNIIFSDDIVATIESMRAFGAKIDVFDDYILVDGSNVFASPPETVIDCRESGSTLRFLIPLALHTDLTTFIASKRLGERPLDSIYNIFDSHNIEYTKQSAPFSLTVEKGSISEHVVLDGNISSQFLSGLLFSLPLFSKDFRITLSSPLESKGYVDLTLDMLKKFGIAVENREYSEFIVQGGQRYIPHDYCCEGDFSQAAFFLSASALGHDITCCNLNPESLQGDKKILDILKLMGADIIWANNIVRVSAPQLNAIEIDASQIPDLVPILATVATFAHGNTVIYNASRLRLKESDRLASISDVLNKLGSRITEFQDKLIIQGSNGKSLHGDVNISSYNDHRIAMSIAIASSLSIGTVALENPRCVRKSYPHFWDDYTMLGGITLG